MASGLVTSSKLSVEVHSLILARPLTLIYSMNYHTTALFCIECMNIRIIIKSMIRTLFTVCKLRTIFPGSILRK